MSLFDPISPEESLRLLAAGAVPWSTVAEFAAALEVTRAFFAVEPTFEVMEDPYNPGYGWIAFAVVCGGGTTRDRIDQQLEWHRRIEAVIPNHVGRFCISIIRADDSG